VIKDPRICRLVPLWTSVLERIGVEAVFLIAFRNPIEVAESLKVRDGFHPAKSLLMWLRHVIDAERNLSEVVDRIEAQLDLADRAFGPLIADYENRESDRAARVSSLEREAASWRARSERLQADLEEVRGSTSWRLTEPLRRARAWWRARREAPRVFTVGARAAPSAKGPTADSRTGSSGRR